MVKVATEKLKLLFVSCFLLLVSAKGQSFRQPIAKIIPHSPSIAEYTKTNHTNNHQLCKNFGWFVTEEKKKNKEVQLNKNKSFEVWTFTLFSIFSFLSKKEQRIISKFRTWIRQRICPDDIIRYLFRHPNEDGTWVFSITSQKTLFLLSSITTIQEIRTNGINSIRRRKISGRKIQVKSLVNEAGMVLSDRIFPPRLHFTIGALARGIQLCTNIQYAFDPSPGFGALVNFGAVWVRQRWVPRFILGWALTEKLWKLFGAKPPSPRPQSTSNNKNFDSN